MARIICSGCGRDLSDRVRLCPHCGGLAEDDPRKQKLFDSKGRPREPYRWELERAGVIPPRRRNSRLLLVVFGFFALIFAIGFLPDQGNTPSTNSGEPFLEASSEKRYQQSNSRQSVRKRDRASTRQNKRSEKPVVTSSGVHCLSQLDGSHWAFKREIRDSMRNPKSFEHIETRITPKTGDGSHLVIMKYRAENGFGGMTIGTATASVKNSDCSHRVLTAE